jgi:hypothetical protein
MTAFRQHERASNSLPRGHQRVPQIQERFAEARIGLERLLIEHRGVRRLAAPLADQTGIVEQFRGTSPESSNCR